MRVQNIPPQLRIWYVVAAIACMAAGGAARAQVIALAPGATASEHPTLAPLIKKVTPAVVNISVISTKSTQSNPLLQDPFFQRFFDLPERPEPMPQQSVT